jgi:predicted phage terminase large subunit-like protein
LASTPSFSVSDDRAARLALLAAVVAKRKAVALAPEGKLLDFTRWYFPEREGMEFIEGPHHRIIGDTLDRVLSGEITRLIINVPPGYTKTEAAVVNFIAKGFHINPKARFIHSTFSDDLARENSDKVLQLVALEGYQAVKAVEIRHDSSAKDRWKTTAGGGMLAKAAGGPITGFRAGYMDKTMFTGALVIDDPLKPDDAFSPTKRKTVNQRATNTFRSRLAHDGVPIIAIMQRLHSDDFAGHLLTGGTGEKWHHLNLPVMINNSEPYPIEWTHGIPIQHNLPDGPLWREKHDEAEIEVLKADAYTYASQYMQRPVSIEGALFNMDGFKWWNLGELPTIEYYTIYADTAQKTGERNDFSVFQLWGKAATGIYLVDQVRGKWGAPELDDMAATFWEKHKRAGRNVRGFKVEDKASGTGLIQSLRKKGLPMIGIPRDKDKYTRGLDAAPWVATGMVHLPANEEWTVALRAELQMFDGLGTGWDDQVDPLMDAVADMLAETGAKSSWFL